MDPSFSIGDRVNIRLREDVWGSDGWFPGTVIKIEPYSDHRSFYWVELDPVSQAILGRGIRVISVLNPKNIQPINQPE